MENLVSRIALYPDPLLAQILTASTYWNAIPEAAAWAEDWAIVKHEDETLYLVRETKGTKDFLKLRTTEADKVRCGEQHFKALDVPFAVVVDDRGV